MEPCYPNSRSQCNRQPFLSESGCDRGSVDIHQFDDLPYCGPINPTEPKIPNEIVDVPVSVPLPSFSCSCFNMEIKPKFQYNGKRKFVASASFRAIGDCCEGNYETNLDLQIPCPVYGNGDKKIRMSIGYGESKSYFSSTYMSVNSSSCEIKVKDIDVNLNIPCPIRERDFGSEAGKYAHLEAVIYIEHQTDGTMNLERIPPEEYKYSYDHTTWLWTVSCRNASISFSGRGYMDPSPGFWNVSSHSENIQLYYSGRFYSYSPGHDQIKGLAALYVYGLPPEDEEHNDGRLRIGISYGKDFEGGSASIVGLNHDSCTIEALSPTINLSIPCPIVGEKPEELSIVAKAELTKITKMTEATFLKIDPEACKIEPVEPKLDIAVPCPIDKQPPMPNCLDLNAALKSKGMFFSVKTDSGKWRKVSADDLEITMSPTGRDENRHMTYTISYEGKPLFNMKTNNGVGSTQMESISPNVMITRPERRNDKDVVTQTKKSWSGNKIEALLSGPEGIGPLASVKSGVNALDVYDKFMQETNGDDSFTDKKMHFFLAWGSSNSSASAFAVEADQDECNLQIRSPSIRLDIPCPLKDDRFRFRTSTTGIGGLTITEVSYDPEKCERELEFNLDIPCPIKTQTPAQVSVGITYGAGPNRGTTDVVTVGPENCDIYTNQGDIDLNLKCPVISNNDKTIRIYTKVGDVYDEGSAVFYHGNTLGCEFEANDASISLNIPCPITGTGAKLTFDRLVFSGMPGIGDLGGIDSLGGIGQGLTFDLLDVVDCNVQGKTNTVSLKVPCPTTQDQLMIYGSAEMASGSSFGFGVESDSYSSSGCKRTIRLKAKFPKSVAAVGAFRVEGGVFKDCYFYAAHGVREVSGTIAATDGMWYLNVDHVTLIGELSKSPVRDDDDHTAVPICEIYDGKIFRDYRGMPFIPIYT